MVPSSLIVLAFLLSSVFAAPKPHILVIVADDYGWNNVGYHSTPENAREVVTPTLNSLKTKGIELDRHYVYKFCSPTRSALLSGRNPIHVNVFNTENEWDEGDVLSGYNGVSLNMTLIAGKMREAGYATHYTGKWDAGWATPHHLPINRGFDTGLGYLEHANNYWTHKGGGCNLTDLWYNDGPGYEFQNPPSCSQDNQEGCTYEDDLFTADVLKNIDAHDPSRPLFYYWAHHNIHAPLEVPQDYFDKFPFVNITRRRLYASMVNHLDDAVAKVIAKLQSKGMWDNLFIVFTSDNGGPVAGGSAANNWPLRGGKTSNWEGGVRVNAFVSGGFIPEAVRGTKQENFIGVEDWYATFCSLAGVEASDKIAVNSGLPDIDGHNLWPLLSGQNTTSPRTQIWIGDNLDNNKTIIQGIILPPYKLLTGVVPHGFWQGPIYPNITGGTNVPATQCGTGCLFNIIEDPYEHNNIAATNPQIAARLLATLNEVQKTVFDPKRGEPTNTYCKYARDHYKGFLGPFVDV